LLKITKKQLRKKRNVKSVKTHEILSTIWSFFVVGGTLKHGDLSAIWQFFVVRRETTPRRSFSHLVVFCG